MTSPPRLSWTDVRDVIRGRILARNYGLGAKLPRDEDIAQELGCTRTTVHRAMQDLAAAGLIDRKRKGGTHVVASPITRATIDIPVTRSEVEALGRAYSHRLISSQRTPSPAPIMARFGAVLPRDMLHLSALHLADQKPYMLEDRWVDLATCPEILAVDFAQISANEWLVRHKPYTRVEMRFFAINADAEVAAQFQCGAGEALLTVERTTWLEDAPITTVQAIAAPRYVLASKA
jgi:GntR family histidine utilization transcriptional repressor